jgi:uncharacterized protein
LRIAVLSDTHIGRRSATLPPDFLKLLSSFDRIVHCGDFVSIDVCNTLENAAEFFGVCGNCDPWEIHEVLPTNRIVEIAGFKIGIVHGWGSADGLEERIMALFESTYPAKKPDIILFGHSHKPTDITIDGIRLLNPGSLFGGIGTYGILTLEHLSIKFEIVTLTERER